VAAQLNHTIVWCRDQATSSVFLAEILGRPPPARFAFFDVVEFDNGVSLDFATHEGELPMLHYAFLIGEADFDAVFQRLKDRGLDYWADPGRRKAGEINRNDGGRGVYFPDPDGHLMEVITRPYGSGDGASDQAGRPASQTAPQPPAMGKRAPGERRAARVRPKNPALD
jgi:catechol 2,3-dioxygenase-like lactoylglutathione lyase family enzyme